jgi:hypothetical protein
LKKLTMQVPPTTLTAGVCLFRFANWYPWVGSERTAADRTAADWGYYPATMAPNGCRSSGAFEAWDTDLGLKPEATLRGCSAANRKCCEGTIRSSAHRGPVPSEIRCGAAAEGSLWLQPQVRDSQTSPSCGAATWSIKGRCGRTTRAVSSPVRCQKPRRLESTPIRSNVGRCLPRPFASLLGVPPGVDAKIRGRRMTESHEERWAPHPA